jgi:CBS domain-containing protein
LEDDPVLENSSLVAADLATKAVITVHPHSSVRHAAKLMAENHVSGLPVIDDDGALVGLVSEADLLVWRDEPSERQAWWLDMLSEGFELSPDFPQVAHGVKRVPVVKDGKLVGIVSRGDLVAALAKS